MGVIKAKAWEWDEMRWHLWQRRVESLKHEGSSLETLSRQSQTRVGLDTNYMNIKSLYILSCCSRVRLIDYAARCSPSPLGLEIPHLNDESKFICLAMIVLLIM